MKTLLLLTGLRALLVFLGVLCAITSGHPRYDPEEPEMVFEFGYRAFTNMSPVRRGLLRSEDVASSRLSKRQCGSNLYCPATSFCCNPGYSCCSTTFCCAAGYACPVSGPCYATQVVTITSTSILVVTSSAVLAVSSTSTLSVILTSTAYTTITTHVQNGVSTSTVMVTVTSTQVMKRGAIAAPTPAMTETHDIQAVVPTPSMEAFLVEGQTPIAELLRRALGNVGLVEKRAVTSYVTIFQTSTYYNYISSTVRVVVTSTGNTAVQLTVTSTLVDGASTTTTVTSTVAATVTVTSGHITTATSTPGQSSVSFPPEESSVSSPPGSSSLVSQLPATTLTPTSPVSVTSTSSSISDTDGGLSQGAKIGIGVGVSVAAVCVFGLLGICLWRRRRSTGENGAVSPMLSVAATAVPSPTPMQQAYWAPGKAHELPQQAYPPPQQVHELPQQTYSPPYRG